MRIVITSKIINDLTLCKCFFSSIDEVLYGEKVYDLKNDEIIVSKLTGGYDRYKMNFGKESP